MSAERQFARGLLRLHADLGLQPLAVAIDHGDVRLRHAQHARRQGRDAIEALFRRSIEDAQSTQRLQSVRLVGWDVWLDHDSSRVDELD